MLCDSYMSCDACVTVISDKSLCVSLFGDVDEAKLFHSSSSSQDNSGMYVAFLQVRILPPKSSA